MGHPKMPSGADTINQYPGNCVSMSSTKATALACIINSEVGAVLAVMRRNVRWADHYLATNDQREHPLIQSLMTLRRQLFSWHHRWRDIDPCIYLEPFLDIIQSGETSAPITGVALSSVYKVLILDMIDEDTLNAQNAMQLVVDTVTSCRFEVTDPASEEVVLMKILQVLLACMRCKGSVLLSNKHVFIVVNTCFSIVHQAGSKGELLQRIARNTMHELVRSIFARLQDLDKAMKHEAVGFHTENGHEGELPSNGSNGLSSSRNDDSTVISTLQTMDGNTTEAGGRNDAISSQLPIEKDQYGIPCMVDILHLFASLLNAVEHIGMGPGANSIAFDEDVPMFALGLINSAVELGGASFRYHPTLLSLVKDELFLNIVQYGLSMSPLVLSMVFNIILSLYCHVGTKIKLQLEAFFSCVILKLTQENLDSSYPQQEVALEALVDFCRQKGLMVEMYVNLDCDMTCSNVFENVVDVLARRANPEDGPLSSVHMLALDGLMALVNGMIERIGNGGGMSSRNALSNLEEYMPIWKIKCENYDDPDHWVPFLQWRKQLKKTLMMGVDQFNSDRDLGFEFLQKARLLPDKLDPDSVACLFRYAPGLDKNIIGDYLGSHDLFCIQTLHAFAGTFDFQDMSLDTALRLFLETFRLPGESQKIQRILEAFSERYFVQSPNILANKDAALLLSYSLIMLNTDQHNTQVKKKMTEEEFIRNNRHINGGSDLPREYLSELYHSICKNEISFTGKSDSSAEMTQSHWIELLEKSKRTDPFIVSDSKPYLDRDMFSIMAGPTIAAITAVFDLAEEGDIYQRCIDGFLDVAKVAASHHLENVLDNVVVSLCRFTVLFNLSSFEEPVLGEDMKARMAIEAIFKIANLYGDSIRVSWRSIIDCILKLHKLGLLPAHMASDALESDPKSDSQILASPAKPPVYVQKRPSSGLISKFSQLFSFDIDEPTSDPTEQELEAHKQALEIIENCHVDTIFAESKFLQADSLLQLSQALIWVSDQYQKANGFPAEEDTGTFCLELLITITLNNRDRIGLLWQCVYEHIAKIVQSISIPCAMVEKAVFGLLRICQRLLPYKETLSDELLRSLQLVLKLDARVADTYCEQITREIGCLVKSSAAHINSQTGWRAIVSLLSITARHPEASEPGFDALFFIMSDGAHLLPVNYLLCVDASRQFAESRVGGSDRSILALDMMSGSIDCLSNWAHEAEKMNESDAAKLGQDIGEMWLRLVQGLRKLCSDQREDVRNHAVLSLQNCLIGADKIRLSHSTWSQCFESAIFVMLDELIEISETRSQKDYRNMEGTVVVGLKLVSKVFLQMLNELSGVEGFDKVWVEVLNRMEKCMTMKVKGRKSERVRELVPELLKNTLLVMKARGVLVGGGSLWDTTWTHVNKIVPSLQSELFKEQEKQQEEEGRTGEVLVSSNELSPVPS